MESTADCIVASPYFMEQLEAFFDQNPRAGFLVPPPPNYGKLFSVPGREWFGYCKTVAAVFSDLGLRVATPIEEIPPPVALAGSYWMRKDAFMRIWGDESINSLRQLIREVEIPTPTLSFTGVKEQELLNRLLPFIAQDSGFYTAYVYSDRFASLELTNLRGYVGYISRVGKNRFPGDFLPPEGHASVVDYINESLLHHVKRFIRKRIRHEKYTDL
jgi:rhamnosyltransferase